MRHLLRFIRLRRLRSLKGLSCQRRDIFNLVYLVFPADEPQEVGLGGIVDQVGVDSVDQDPGHVVLGGHQALGDLTHLVVEVVALGSLEI